MNRYLQQSLPLLVISIILVILLACIIIFFGATATTRGPIEILSALLIGVLVLFVRALLRHSQ